jgi:flagellar biosynthetic protein FliQ
MKATGFAGGSSEVELTSTSSTGGAGGLDRSAQHALRTLSVTETKIAMDPQDAVDLGREALLIATLVSAPILLAGMIVGLLIGLLQALTQIQEQTVAFVPKLIAMVLALVFSLPWILSQLMEYTDQLIADIPNKL